MVNISPVFAQQIQVKYFHVRSAIATLYEDLYIGENKVVSIQDSLVNFNTSGDISVVRKTNKPIKKHFFISKLSALPEKSRDFFYTANYLEEEYFIHDKVPKPIWTIDDTNAKKILGYNCIKATTNFRGSSFTAYFTRELPYSAGPFKFYGLPGLILDIREDNKNYNIWKANEIILNSSDKINYSPLFPSKTKITIKNFVALKDGYDKKQETEQLKIMPEGTKIEINNRVGIEKQYEWELMDESK